MVHGIATDGKKYKHINRNDEKWLSKDILVWRRYVERDTQQSGIKNEKEMNESLNDSKKKTLTVIRILQILILGVFGSITLIGGIYLLLKGIYVLGVPSTIIGAVFVIALILNEMHR